MAFNTITFYAVFLLFLMGYALLRRSTREGMMVYVVAFNVWFFYEANGAICLLLPLTALFSWFATNRMMETNSVNVEDTERQRERKRRLWLICIIVVDLLPLLYFKYAGASMEMLREILRLNFPLHKIVLPVGISFYTFQALSHAIDVYRGTFKEKVTLLEYLFYLTFFPFLLAGPITRAHIFFPQIREHYNKTVDLRLMYAGLWLVIVGLIKKAVVADYLAQYNNWIYDDPTAFSGLENLMGAIGYTIQIYCDFSGYSDMSIGIAAILGIELIENFNFPYKSQNISEFWRRWHISLSTWFRDYLYIPLGGNRKGSLRTYLNNFLTMLVAGLWHGSTWMFVFWGALHGTALVVHKACRRMFLDKLSNNVLVITVSWLLTQLFVTLTWVVFRSPDMTTCSKIFSQIGCHFDLSYLPYFINARPLWTLLVVLVYMGQALSYEQSIRLQDWFVTTRWWVKLLILLCVVQLAITIESTNVQPFIYYQF